MTPTMWLCVIAIVFAVGAGLLVLISEWSRLRFVVQFYEQRDRKPAAAGLKSQRRKVS